ncbi:secreted RxLR effector protein 161-like [Rutidosis leptorrhynchoides]|uniref:secreted RxLR effector protein 161-like n=1 Tax=Rutidosis leptorrhynchoides TaxID=125765 RepID=UPI003A998F07
MMEGKPCRTPADTQSKLDHTGPPVADPTLYRSLAGALQYLTFTRPDISYAVQKIYLFMHDPREPHFLALKRILRYLRGTLDYGLQIHVSSTAGLVGYSDADWGGCPTTRRSTSSYCVISRSSAEAEYRGVANAVAETCWQRNFLRELHTSPQKATIVYCDNISSGTFVFFMSPHSQYADIFTKGLPTSLFSDFRSSLNVRVSPPDKIAEGC